MFERFLREGGEGTDRQEQFMKGKVYLVGGGPGDPELLTLKAAKILGPRGHRAA